MPTVHFRGRDIRFDNCRRSAAAISAAILFLGALVIMSYWIDPLTPTTDVYFTRVAEAGAPATQETMRVCDKWDIPDAVVRGGKPDAQDGAGCRDVPVFMPGQRVRLYRSIIWNHLCQITATDSWEPGPGNLAKGMKLKPGPVPTPRATGLVQKGRDEIIPLVTDGLWGHLASDQAACWFWQRLWPINLPPMITEFYVKG